MTRTTRGRRGKSGPPWAVVITGGIGSGKSTFCRLLKTGPDVARLNADRFVRGLLLFSSSVRARVVDLFGTGVLDSSGRIDRPALAARVFSRAADRRRLEALLHPIVRERMGRKVAALKRREGIAIVLAEIPLLVEGGRPDWCDFVVSVEADLEVRLTRLAKRGLDRAAARRRMKSQADDAARRRMADFVIRNDSTREALAREAAGLRRRLLTFDS